MGPNIKKLAVNFGRGLIELGMAFPLLPLLYVYVIQATPFWQWLGGLFACYVAGSMVTLGGKMSKRLQFIVVAVAVAGIVAIVINGWSLDGWMSWALGLLPFYRGVRAASRPWETHFPIRYYWIGLTFYFTASVVFRWVEELQPYVPLITGLGLTALVLSVFMANTSHLKVATLSRGHHSPPGSVKWLNRMLVVGLLVVIALVGNYERLQAAVEKLKGWAIAAVNAIIAFLSQEQEAPVEEEAPLQSPPPDMPFTGEPREPSKWLVVIEQVVFYGMLTVIALGVLVLLYFLAKQLYSLAKIAYRWLLNSVGKAETVEEQGYEDEETNLFDWKEVGGEYAGRVKDWWASLMEREPKWKDLKTNRERIRYLYRHNIWRLIDNGYEFRKDLTPEETKRDVKAWDGENHDTLNKRFAELVALYARARYSLREIEDEEVARVRE